MGQTRASRAVAGTATSFLQYGLLMALQFALAPVVLRLAGQEVLGAYSFILQVMGWAALTDLGFGVAISRSLAQAHGMEDERKRFRDVFVTGRTFLSASNLVFGLVLLGVGWNVDNIMSMSPTAEDQARTAVFLLAAWVAIRIPVSLYGEALIATQNLAAANIIVALGNALRLLLSLLFVFLGWELIGLMAGFVLAEAAIACTQRFWYRRLYPEDKFGWGVPDRGLFREMFNFGLTYMVMVVAGRLSASTDSIIVGYLYGAAAVSVYYTSQMPGTVLYQLIWKPTDNSAPALNELHARRAFPQITVTYLRLLRYTLLLILPLSVGIAAFNRSAIMLWVGEAQYAGGLFTAALAVFSFTQVVIHLNAIVLVAYGRVRAMSLFSLCAGIVKVVLALQLGKNVGLAGVMIANASVDIAAIVFYDYSVRKLLGLSFSKVWRDAVSPVARAIVPPAFALIVFFALMPSVAWYSLLFWVSVYTLMTAVGAWSLGLLPDERDQVTVYVKNGLNLAVGKSGGM